MLGRPADFARRLIQWYSCTRRVLPWRVSRDAPEGTLPDAYHVLVSEAMLQQTQVVTVSPYFLRFIERFPTLASLASADPQEVLRLWQGLGYYSRARNLHATAQIVAARFGGRIPSRVDELMSLPGIGRYTAGAIASLAFDVRAPAVDGNVARVLCRLDRMHADPSRPAVRQRLFRRAEQLLPRRRVGDFNSALMELGATLCTPRQPKCPLCPVRQHCVARAAGVQQRIPPARSAGPRPLERRWVVCISRAGRWLLEQRPPAGRWAGMWQFITLAAGDGSPTARQIKAHTGLTVSAPQPIGRLDHALSHRQYRFAVFACQARGGRAIGGRAWVGLRQLSDLPLPRPHTRVAEMLLNRTNATDNPPAA